MKRTNIEIQQESNIATQNCWIAFIEKVFAQRNDFYSQTINNIVDCFNHLEPQVQGCAGNTPKPHTVERILSRYEILTERTAMLYQLAQMNFRGFEITHIRHTLEVFLQYLHASEDHFRLEQYIDAKLRILDARHYITKAFLAAEKLVDPLSE